MGAEAPEAERAPRQYARWCEAHRTRPFLVLQRHFALLGSAASVLGTLQRGLIIFATY
jgi:hypothetical protein